jgi:uncharacterized protein (TIGR02246 family)
LAFVEAINAHDPERLTALMAEDHVFVDSDGTRQSGTDRLRQSWRGYFALVPDYRIHVEETLVQGPTVALFGEAEGTFAREGRLETEDHWRVPAAWRALVRGGKVAVWQVYVNPEPLMRLLNRVKGE